MKFSQALLALSGCLASLDGAHAVPSKRQSSRPAIEPATLQSLITEAGLRASINSFQQIATANGGNRAFGRPGFDASVRYVVDRLSQLEGVRVHTQNFTAQYSSDWVGEITINGAAAKAYGVWYSPATPEGGLTAQLVDGPAGAAACGAQGYAGLDVRGKVVLVERGNCPGGLGAGYLEGRMLPAAAAGAAAVIIFSDLRSTSAAGGFSRAARPGDVPTGFLSQADGRALRARLQAGERLTVGLKTGNVIDRRPTQNVIAETVAGDASKTIVFGAHLDSVPEGPGINDNASGSSLLLELATALVQLASPRYKVRFAWWAAEERGLWGSEHYASQLSASEAADVLAYVNFDMVGKGFSGVFDGDGSAFSKPGPAGSGTIQKLLTQGFQGQGLTVTPAELSERSDYKAFWRTLGKPIGGTHSGVSQDRCYHSACDNVTNIDFATLTSHTKAAAHALAIMAMKGLDV